MGKTVSARKADFMGGLLLLLFFRQAYTNWTPAFAGETSDIRHTGGPSSAGETFVIRLHPASAGETSVFVIPAKAGIQ
jgi:hypothetical protein